MKLVELLVTQFFHDSNRFFQQYPDYQKKFRSFANVPVAELADNKRLQAHAFTVMKAIDGLIDNLDDPEVLTELLQRTGANHARRGLVIADFQVRVHFSFVLLFFRPTFPFIFRINSSSYMPKHGIQETFAFILTRICCRRHQKSLRQTTRNRVSLTEFCLNDGENPPSSSSVLLPSLNFHHQDEPILFLFKNCQTCNSEIGLLCCCLGKSHRLLPVSSYM